MPILTCKDIYNSHKVGTLPQDGVSSTICWTVWISIPLKLTLKKSASEIKIIWKTSSNQTEVGTFCGSSLLFKQLPILILWATDLCKEIFKYLVKMPRGNPGPGKTFVKYRMFGIFMFHFKE